MTNFDTRPKTRRTSNNAKQQVTQIKNVKKQNELQELNNTTLNIVKSNINNFYFITFDNELIQIYENYRYGIEQYNRILCEGINFKNIGDAENNDIISYDNNSFKSGLGNIFNKIMNNFVKIPNNLNFSSCIALNLNKLYSFIFKDIKYDNQSLNINNNNLPNNKSINSKVPIYVTWGQLTPKMMYYMELNKKNNFNDYLINFGPSYIDELYRLNNLVYNLHNNSLSSNSDISNLTIIYTIIDGDFYNTAFNYFYNYAKKITLINLPDYKYYEARNIISVEYNSDDSNETAYNDQINKYYNDKIIFELSHNSIYNHPNVVLINIPIAETQNDYNKSYYGNAINKSFHLIEKYYNDNHDTSNNNYIYIKTQEISKSYGTENDITYYGEYELLNMIHNNSFIKNILKNKKMIISSYNNIEFSLRTINQNNNKYNMIKNIIFDISYLNILSSYNINYNPNILLQLQSDISSQYSKKNFKIKNINLDFQVNSNQKQYLGILDSNLMNYLVNKVLNNNYQGNFFSNNEIIRGNDICGSIIYKEYKNLEKIIIDETFEKTFENTNNNYINNIFEYLINNYSNTNSINFSSTNVTNSRIKNFSIFNINYDNNDQMYKFNKKIIENSNIEINSIIDSSNDKFEKLVSTIFYEKFYLKDISGILETSDNYIILDNNALENIIDLSYSYYSNNHISNTNPIIYILNKYPNVSLKIIDLCNIIIYKNYNDAINDVSSLNINDLMEIRVDPYILRQSGFNPYIRVQLEFNHISNIYNNNNISLISNIATININNSLKPRVTISNESLSITIPENTIYVQASLNNYDICFNDYIIYTSDYYDKSQLILDVPIIEVSSNLGKIATIDYTVTDPCNIQVKKNLDIIVYNNTLFDISNILIEPSYNLTLNQLYSNIIINHNNGRKYNYLDVSNQYICDLCYNIIDMTNVDAIINTHEISYNILNIITDISISGTKNLYITPGESFEFLYESGSVLTSSQADGFEDYENLNRSINLGIQDSSFIYNVYDISSILDINLTNNIVWDTPGIYDISGSVTNILNSVVFTLNNPIKYRIAEYSLADISINSDSSSIYTLDDISGMFNSYVYDNLIDNTNSKFLLKLMEGDTYAIYDISSNPYQEGNTVFPNENNNEVYIFGLQSQMDRINFSLFLRYSSYVPVSNVGSLHVIL